MARLEPVRIANSVAALLLVAGAQVAASAARAETVLMLPVQNVLSSADAREKLDGSVRFYFGKTPHPAIVANLGSYITNKKTNGVGKEDEAACSWVMLSALIALQERAKQLGANAVVNIHSFYRKNEISSDDAYECHAGAIMAGVALKGDMVKLGR